MKRKNIAKKGKPITIEIACIRKMMKLIITICVNTIFFVKRKVPIVIVTILLYRRFVFNSDSVIVK